LRRCRFRENIHIALAAQFNRELKDLLDVHETSIREAADIEQIAETIVGVYDVRRQPKNGEKNSIVFAKDAGNKGLYFKILKSRHLPAGEYEVLDYDPNTNKIENSEL
jgi:hypothetical protein